MKLWCKGDWKKNKAEDNQLASSTNGFAVKGFVVVMESTVRDFIIYSSLSPWIYKSLTKLNFTLHRETEWCLLIITEMYLSDGIPCSTWGISGCRLPHVWLLSCFICSGRWEWCSSCSQSSLTCTWGVQLVAILDFRGTPFDVFLWQLLVDSVTANFLSGACSLSRCQWSMAAVTCSASVSQSCATTVFYGIPGIELFLCGVYLV